MVDQAAGILKFEALPSKFCLIYRCSWIRLQCIRSDRCTWSRLQCCCSQPNHRNLRCLMHTRLRLNESNNTKCYEFKIEFRERVYMTKLSLNY